MNISFYNKILNFRLILFLQSVNLQLQVVCIYLNLLLLSKCKQSHVTTIHCTIYKFCVYKQTHIYTLEQQYLSIDKTNKIGINYNLKILHTLSF